MEPKESISTIVSPGPIPTHVRRVFKPEEVQEVFRRGILEGKGIDIDKPEDHDEIVVPITKEIEEICESVRDRVVWGVYGSDGQLRRITEIRDIEQLTKKDARAFKMLYMDGLKTQPEVFGSTFQAVRLNRVKDFQTFIADEDNYVTGVKHSYHDERGKLQEGLVGMATLTRETGMRSHRAWFGKLYVHIPFYERIGFKSKEIQYKAARIGGYDYDWLTMELDMDTYRRIRQGEVECQPDSEQ